jgi:hypothetical protein
MKMMFVPTIISEGWEYDRGWQYFWLYSNGQKWVQRSEIRHPPR